MDKRTPDAYPNVADVTTEAYNMRRDDQYEVVVRLRRGALRIGPATYWLDDGTQHQVSLVGFTIRNMYHRADWPKEPINSVKVMLDDAPSPTRGPGRYIGQEDISSPVIIPSRDIAVRGDDGRKRAEALAHWLRHGARVSGSVVRTDDRQTDDPALMEWGLSLENGLDRPLRLALRSIDWFD